MTDDEMIHCDDASRQLERLRAIMHRLRAPNGCPWDAEQTHESLLSNLIEEAYEVVDAIQAKDQSHLREELGDVLLQVVFHSEIASETKTFDFDSVAQTISEKLIRRHPHVFGENEVSTTNDVLTQWDEIKRQEKGLAPDLPYLHDVGKGLPALLTAYKLQKKASKVGFDWSDPQGALRKVHEETSEVESALIEGDEDHLSEELGDLLFSVVNLIRKTGKNPEIIMQNANGKFRERFTAMEQKLPSLVNASLEEMEATWQHVKQKKQ